MLPVIERSLKAIALMDKKGTAYGSGNSLVAIPASDLRKLVQFYLDTQKEKEDGEG